MHSCRSRCRKGSESAVLRGTDRGWCCHVYGIQKYGSLGLFRSHEVPKIKAIVVDKPGLKVACGAIGIGEITSIPTAPAIADAYFRYDGIRRYNLPLTDTPYERKG